jgi:transposase-like protein
MLWLGRLWEIWYVFVKLLSQMKGRYRMKSQHPTEARLIAVHADVAAGSAIKVACKSHGISESTFYRWKRKRQTPSLEAVLPPGVAHEIIDDHAVVTRILGPLEPLRKEMRNRSILRIADLAQSTFGRPAPRHPSARSKELLRVGKLLERTLTNLDHVREDIWGPILGDIRWMDTLERETIDELLATIFANACHTGGIYREEDGGKPGPYPDCRIDLFLVKLAFVFKRATGDDPRHTIDPLTDLPVSQFDKFAMECFQAFFPGERIPWSVIRKAMKPLIKIPWDNLTSS